MDLGNAYKVGWINQPTERSEPEMNTKYVIAAIVIIAAIATATIIYVYNENQKAVELAALQNLTDDKGHVTSLSAYPNRIISLAPSNTEILYAVGAGDKVVGVSDYDNYPYNFTAWIAAGNMTSIGDFSSPNMEVIASLNPDLILATAGVQGETVDTLRALGNKVLVLDPPNVEGVLNDILLVGKATGKNAEATSLVSSLRARMDAVVAKVANAQSKPEVYYEVWYDSTSLWSAGSKAFQNELIQKAGGTNIFEDQPLDYFQSSSEAVVERNPDVILLPSSGMGFGTPFWGTIADVKARPGWDSISAVKNDKLYEVDSDTIARAGPRVADAIEDLAAIFHPDLF